MKKKMYSIKVKQFFFKSYQINGMGLILYQITKKLRQIFQLMKE